MALIADNGITLTPPVDEDQWQEWASWMADELDAPALPSPLEFSKWDDWAQASLAQLQEIA